MTRELARRHFPGESPIGKRLRTTFDFSGGAPATIIGVVDDVKQTALDDEQRAGVYLPASQMPYPALTVVVRTEGDPSAVLPAMRRELTAMDRSLAFANVRSLREVFSQSLARQRFSMVVLALFAAMALALALVGLYGVIALSVGQRRRELGVRLALGARPRDVMRLVLGESLQVVGVGLALGCAGAFALARVLRTLLYEVQATSAAVYVGACAVVAVVALLACLAPARRATRVDPVLALRAS